MPLSLDRQYSFENYFASSADLIIDSLKSLVIGRGESQLGLWGSCSSGKTHLLNACAGYAREAGAGLQIYDAMQLLECEASEFVGFEQCDVLAIDNLDAIAGIAAWEERFYQVMNRCRQGEFRFIFSLSVKPQHLACKLDDFRSRLLWGLLLQLPENSEDEIRGIMRRRAELLGMELSSDVISYLLNHHSRNLGSQMQILRLLDNASLLSQRRVTIPLVKQALAEQSSTAQVVLPAR